MRFVFGEPTTGKPSAQIKTKKAALPRDPSFCVGTTGFEPAATRPPDVYSTGLSYVPKNSSG